jgi:hypothetical protein
VRKIALFAGLVVALAPAAARADVSSWFSTGGGYTFQRDDSNGTTARATMLTFACGVGTSPREKVMLGGGLRMTTNFTLGTDLALLQRVATGGFARGDWGFGVDFGIVGRWYSHGYYGEYPLQLMLLGGTPWGFQLGIGGNALSVSGERSARGVFAVLEFDFLRFTVMRQGSSERWWPNPLPAGGSVTQ